MDSEEGVSQTEESQGLVIGLPHTREDQRDARAVGDAGEAEVVKLKPTLKS